MKINFINAISLFSILLFSCSNTTKLIHKTKTQYGNLKFYTERVANSKDSIARVYAAVDSNGYKIYYNFYPNSIVKTAETEKQISYTVYYGKLSENYNKNIYVKFNSIDSLVLSQGDILIDLFQYNNIKKSKGAEAYITEIVYYHGWPKHKDFKP